MAKRVETFSFDGEADKDIARWLAGLPSRGKSAAIRAAIREHAGRNGITLGDVYRVVKDLERKRARKKRGTSPMTQLPPWIHWQS
jgi:hypothetical protein